MFFVAGIGVSSLAATGDTNTGAISLKISLPKESYSKYEPVVVQLWVSNLTKEEIEIQEPDLWGRTIRLQIMRDGKEVPPNVILDGPPWGPRHTLAPGDTKRFELEVVDRWDPGLAPGEYTIQAKYVGGELSRTAGKVSWAPAISNTVSFSVTPASEAEEKEAKEFIGSVCNTRNINACKRFLEAFPASQFAPRVRFEMLCGLATSGRVDEARDEYAMVITGGGLTRSAIRKAHWYMADALEKKGLFQEAIAILEKWPREQDNIKDQIVNLKKKAKEAAATPTKEVQPTPSP
jgi:hypothetical protein